MHSGTILDFEKLIRTGRQDADAGHQNKAGKNLKETPRPEHKKRDPVCTSDTSQEKPGNKRVFSIRSKVQSIRDDLYRNGEYATSLEFCYVPAGTFRMGKSGSFYRVSISKSFYLGKYPVTQEQWETVMGNNPSSFIGSRHPVENVSWEDCQQFIDKLNGQIGRERYRLPTEAEWEYACRAGSITTYSFGDDTRKLREHGWYHANSGDKSHAVGQKLPNAWGLHDMNGGVWEWCSDWYAPYPRWKAIDPQGPGSGSDRVLRGGSWFDGPKRCRSSFRSYFSPDFRCNFFGFRLTRKA